MRYDFLKHFPKRMKHVGLYAVLLQGSLQKTTWQKYGFVRADEQINLIFAVLLYIMEQSLKEEYCTKDDIGVFIDELNMEYLKKEDVYKRQSIFFASNAEKSRFLTPVIRIPLVRSIRFSRCSF